MRNLILTLIAIVLPVSFALADGRPYGAGGCGLGSMVLGKDGNQTLAITTNGTGTQTFGISSGTSNCVDAGVVKKGKEARAFIEINQIQLANDIAKGRGEALSSLARLYDCSDAGAFGAALQRHYGNIYIQPSQNTTDQIENSIQQIIHTELAETCVG